MGSILSWLRCPGNTADTPGGRAQAEKYLKDCISKIHDKIFQNEIENEYNNRKFNQWHKWKKTEYKPEIKLPDIDIMTINMIKSIVYFFVCFPWN